ncbi:MAG: hypothetical protein KAR42_00015 [candidate division Zixibacteria bacterium]|nr:hypothetical protein [candidate division Zixibacteria bacterium]
MKQKTGEEIEDTGLQDMSEDILANIKRPDVDAVVPVFSETNDIKEEDFEIEEEVEIDPFNEHLNRSLSLVLHHDIVKKMAQVFIQIHEKRQSGVEQE